MMLTRSSWLLALLPLALAACAPTPGVEPGLPPVGLAATMAPGTCFDFEAPDYVDEVAATEALLRCYPVGSEVSALRTILVELGARRRDATPHRTRIRNFTLPFTVRSPDQRIRYLNFTIRPDDAVLEQASATCFDFEDMTYATREGGQAAFDVCYPRGYQMEPIIDLLLALGQDILFGRAGTSLPIARRWFRAGPTQ